MSAPIWMASPPEVHSALLSRARGLGATIAAATAWTVLASEYATAADELADAAGNSPAGAWQGQSAEAYQTAHAPYLAWLVESGQASATMATQLEVNAASFAIALSAMPSLPEIAANRASHAVLIATNFLGINTIPIAANEVDYARMWVQAATTMSLYQAESVAAVSATPRSAAAPQIAKASAGQAITDPNDPFGLGSLLQQLEQFEGGNSLLDLIWPGNPFTAYPPGTNFATALADVWQSFTDGLFVYDPQTLAFVHNPGQLIAVLALAGIQLITHRIFDLVQLAYNFPQLLIALVPLVTTSVSAASGLSGLAAMAAFAQPVPPPALPLAPDIPQQPSASVVPTSAPTTPPASAPVSPMPASATPASTAPPPPPPVTGSEAAGFPYLIGGGPGLGAVSGIATQNTASKPSDSKNASGIAMAAARHPRQRRRRKKPQLPELARGFEYMDANPPDADGLGARSTEPEMTTMTTTDHHARPLGFTGAVRTEGGVAAGGLTISPRDTLDGQAHLPLLPETWGHQNGGADR